MGAIAAAMTKSDKLGYVADYPIYGTVANINVDYLRRHPPPVIDRLLSFHGLHLPCATADGLYDPLIKLSPVPDRRGQILQSPVGILGADACSAPRR